MLIGLATPFLTNNYGTKLQAFALQNTIENRYNICTEIIDYKCEAIEKTKHCNKISDFKGLLKFLPLCAYYYIKRRGFSKFRRENLNLTAPLNKENIVNIKDDFQIIITGSDQVWNPECSGDDYTYFLDFAGEGVNKISYAASIGSHSFTDTENAKVIDLLSKFSKISVRESSGALQLKNLGFSDVEVISDPVTLLSEDEWKKYATAPLEKEDYVLVYLILPDVNVTKAAEEYARKHNCKVINNKQSLKFMLHNSPSDFISWISNAKCVFTNSFHGTAFSLIFNKPLGADIALNNGKQNNRVLDFLKKVDALDCIITDEKLNPVVPNVSDNLAAEQLRAFEYLDSVFY